MLPFTSRIGHASLRLLLIAVFGLGSIAVFSGTGGTHVYADTTIAVTTASDLTICTTVTSLRCAITTANSNISSTTRINFQSGLSIISVSSPLTLSNSSQPITIDGQISGSSGFQGATEIDGGSKTQILNISAGTVVLVNLTFTNGYASQSSASNGLGGAIAATSNTTLNISN